MKNNDVNFVRMLFVLIGIVIIIGIVGIFFIWKNFFTKMSEPYQEKIEKIETGKFLAKTYSSTNVAEKYLNYLNDYFQKSDVDKIYTIFSEQYLDFYKYNKEDIYSILKNKGILGRKFLIQGINVAKVDGQKVYNLNLNSEDNMSSFSLNIIEKSPNNISITLDNFLLISTKEKSQIKDGLKLDIKKITYYTDRIVTEANLINSNNYVTFINSQSLHENIFYRDSANNIDYVTQASVFNGDAIDLEPNSNLSLVFDINISFTEFSSLDSLVVKDVNLTENSSLAEYQFDFDF